MHLSNKGKQKKFSPNGKTHEKEKKTMTENLIKRTVSFFYTPLFFQ